MFLFSSRWENRRAKTEDRKDLMPRYFGDLSESDMEKLYRIYKADFELFGYEYDRSEFVRSTPQKRSPKSNRVG